ncbi:hypothetical protein C8A01DRAFT_46611 [Parachaetomium inaequale]|uniref:Efflux pump antibiotic resistance protein n=1 Tax=Parachaetomium inaequale TaxID=2588326 RepID=A0AAN6SR63_9PEZI|nr:hypothetical protein C8A01DRAFT_46611 [Parachaetomium inaequale]
MACGQTENPGLQIINAALPRMGTKSMALAYQTLGFKAHHGLLEEPFDTPWPLLEEAAEATWPDVHGPHAPSRPRPPYARQDWDRLWGNDYDVVTDLAAPFTLELIKAYPEAKVVVIQRDFEPWWKSFKSRLFDCFMVQPRAAITQFVCWNVFGLRAVHALRKAISGMLGGRTTEECEKNARTAYERYYERVRKAVPESRRLEYQLNQGWGPLCEFLGVEVPKTEFPRVNSKEEHRQEIKARFLKMWIRAARAALPGVVGLVIVLLAWPVITYF